MKDEWKRIGRLGVKCKEFTCYCCGWNNKGKKQENKEKKNKKKVETNNGGRRRGDKRGLNPRVR